LSKQFDKHLNVFGISVYEDNDKAMFKEKCCVLHCVRKRNIEQIEKKENDFIDEIML